MQGRACTCQNINVMLDVGHRQWQCKANDFLQVNAGIARSFVHLASPLCLHSCNSETQKLHYQVQLMHHRRYTYMPS